MIKNRDEDVLMLRVFSLLGYIGGLFYDYRGELSERAAGIRQFVMRELERGRPEGLGDGKATQAHQYHLLETLSKKPVKESGIIEILEAASEGRLVWDYTCSPAWLIPSGLFEDIFLSFPDSEAGDLIPDDIDPDPDTDNT